ncbi:MAG: class I SAM-dependent methyltransferase [Pseudomonadota bacterium]
MLKPLKNTIAGALSFAPTSLRTRFKEFNELMFWRMHKIKSGNEFYSAHMPQFFTKHFGLELADYNDKRILDVGCGPVGTLEWADMALERIGADPLANQYLKLGADRQKMKYVAAASEDLPFEDGYFDVVSMFNALDHVEDTAASIAELRRVCRPGGDLLIIVEINHKPTVSEPHFLTEEDILSIEGFDVVTKKVTSINEAHDVYQSLMENSPPSDPNGEAILSVHFRKKTI